MPLPNPAVLNAFLTTYKEIREAKWGSVTNRLVSYLGSYAGQDIPGDRKSECEKLEDRFNNVKTAQEWLEVVHELDEKAQIASKQAKLDSSLLAETLHAIRSYIIAMLKYKPKPIAGEKSKESAPENTLDMFNAEIDRLLEEKTSIETKIRQNRDRCADSSVIDALKENKRQILMKLVHLNHSDSIYEANDLGFLPATSLLYPNRADRLDTSPYRTREHAVNASVNPSVPWYYQRAYYFIFYNKSFFEKTRKEFRAYLKDAVKNALKKREVDIEAILLDENIEEQEEIETKELPLETDQTTALAPVPSEIEKPISNEEPSAAQMPQRLFHRRPRSASPPPRSESPAPAIEEGDDRPETNGEFAFDHDNLEVDNEQKLGM